MKASLRFIMSLLLVFLAGQAWAEKPTTVEVTNTPLPVTGSVNGSVTVTNTASNPVKTTEAFPRTGYVSTQVDHIDSSSGHCGSVGCILFFPPVPEGKRLVIKHVAVRFVSSTKTMLAAELQVPLVPSGDYLAEVFLPIPQIVPPHSGSLFAFWSIISQPVDVYVEAGQTPQIEATLDAGASSDFVTATLTGYLVDTP